MILLHKIESPFELKEGASPKPIHHILVNENLIQYVEPVPKGSKIVMSYSDAWNSMRLYVSESVGEIFCIIRGEQL